MVNDKVAEGKQDTATENTVSLNVFADREDFGSTLLTAAAGTNDSNALRRFDGQDGGPVIVDDRQRDKVTALPVDFSGIPEERLKQMNEDATQLIRNYLTEQTPTGGPDLSLSFNNIADVEKCRLWSEVRNLMQERGVHILDADEKPEMIDSWKGSRDPWHALITLNSCAPPVR
jgi:hypothetical protein